MVERRLTHHLKNRFIHDHSFKLVSCVLGIGFNAECSSSGQRIAEKKTGHPRQFLTQEAVRRFDADLGEPLFKACANDLLLRHGAHLLFEDQCASGPQKTFSLATRFGTAEVASLDSMVIFRFLDPNQSFPWGMAGDRGYWNFYPTDGDLRQLLCKFADGVERSCVKELISCL